MLIKIEKKRKDFQIQVNDDEPINVFIAGLNVADKIRMSEIMESVTRDGEEHSFVQGHKFMLARTIVSVRDAETGNYLWTHIDELNGYPDELILEIEKLNAEINPLPTATESFEAKKKQS